MKAVISVLTVTFNAIDILPRLIDSLKAQTDQCFEWILVDGASTDGTVELIKSSDDIVTQWISEPDFGVYHAMNKAIQMAAGDYYLVVGADDRLEPNAIEQFKYYANLTKADIITAWIIRDGKIDKGKPRLPWIFAMHAYIINHSVSALIKRSLHDQYGLYSKRFTMMADMYFIKTACKDGTTKICRAPFLSGEFGNSGVSSVDKVTGYCDYFRVQFETERFKSVQILLFIAKLIWRSKYLIMSSNRSR